jgi:hypothetical protein
MTQSTTPANATDQPNDDIVCECGKKVEMSPAEAKAFLEAKSHFPFIAPPKCKDCREARAV